jgi:hypothetical protein
MERRDDAPNGNRAWVGSCEDRVRFWDVGCGKQARDSGASPALSHLRAAVSKGRETRIPKRAHNSQSTLESGPVRSGRAGAHARELDRIVEHLRDAPRTPAFKSFKRNRTATSARQHRPPNRLANVVPSAASLGMAC